MLGRVADLIDALVNWAEVLASVLILAHINRRMRPIAALELEENTREIALSRVIPLNDKA